MVLTPAPAPLVHVHRVSPGSVEVFAVDEPFFWEHVPGGAPEGATSCGLEQSSAAPHGPEVLAMFGGRHS
jgi:hypothetical protein